MFRFSFKFTTAIICALALILIFSACSNGTAAPTPAASQEPTPIATAEPLSDKEIEEAMKAKFGDDALVVEITRFEGTDSEYAMVEYTQGIQFGEPAYSVSQYALMNLTNRDIIGVLIT